MSDNSFPKTARKIRIEDIDRGVKNWFEKVVAANVKSPQGELHPVSVTFAAGERWVAAADRKSLRDKDGRLILPIIHIRRVSIDTSTNMSGLGVNTPTMQISRLVHEKQSQLQNADYSRPLSSRRLQGSSVYEIYSVPFPINSTLNYKIVIHAQYQTHINEIIEKILSKFEFVDVPSFVIDLSLNSDKDRNKGIATGNGTTEKTPIAGSPFEIRKQLSDYFVVGYLDGDIASEGNLDEFTDQERIIQLQFNFKVPAPLIFDPEGNKPYIKKETTAFGIFLGDEEVTVVDNIEDLDKIFGPK